MSDPTRGPVAGIVLGAGAGTRYGGPKALVDGWLPTATTALLDGGCDLVVVVLGAAAEAARPLVPDGVEIVVAERWREGMGASLRAGLDAVRPSGAVAAVVHLVDLPDVGSSVVRRLVRRAGPEVLARAVYRGNPGHPVLLGRDHWDGVMTSAVGDQGARAYLADRDVLAVECGDLADGTDVDRPVRRDN